MTTTPARARTVEFLPLDGIPRAAKNAKAHDLPAIRRSIEQFGCTVAGVLDERTGRLVAGHGRLAALTGMRDAGASPPDGITVDGDGNWLVPVLKGWASRSDAEAAAYLIADNRLSERGGWDDRALTEMLDGLASQDPDLLAVAGYSSEDLDDLLKALEEAPDYSDRIPEGTDTPGLAARFLLPPFDVLDGRAGWWRERKRWWIGLGIRSELGREEGLVGNTALYKDPDLYRPGKSSPTSGTSIFDPVLCELAYRWYTPPGARILDPFAGGSVRGLVAGMLRRHYTGNDLSGRQAEENAKQAAEFTGRGLLAAEHTPSWTVGDSRDWVTGLPAGSADLVFTCPPYLWLERYSDDPADLSNQSAEDFERGYQRIIAGAARALRNDRFAIFVTGDVRDGKGHVHDLRGMTIRACEKAGLRLNNAAVLLTPVGSAAARSGPAFTRTRTLTHVHQNVMVFWKGDRSRAAKFCGGADVDFHVPEEAGEDTN